MSKSIFDKLAKRLLPGGESATSGPSALEEKFSELAEVDFESIAAAHTSNHASVHFSTPPP